MLPRLLVAATVAVAMLAVVPATSAEESPEFVVSAAERAVNGSRSLPANTTEGWSKEDVERSRKALRQRGRLVD